MTLKYLITTQTKGPQTEREIFNKYAVYDGEQRVRAPAGYSTREAYFESKAEKDTKAHLQGLLGEAALIRSMPDPADFRFVVFEALWPVVEKIEVVTFDFQIFIELTPDGRDMACHVHSSMFE